MKKQIIEWTDFLISYNNGNVMKYKIVKKKRP